MDEVTGEIHPCFVKHLAGDEFYVIPENTVTHAIQLPDGNEQNVRMMLRVGNECIDLIDFHDKQGEFHVSWTERLLSCV